MPRFPGRSSTPDLPPITAVIFKGMGVVWSISFSMASSKHAMSFSGLSSVALDIRDMIGWLFCGCFASSV